jgi:hypothetical protein
VRSAKGLDVFAQDAADELGHPDLFLCAEQQIALELGVEAGGFDTWRCAGGSITTGNRSITSDS